MIEKEDNFGTEKGLKRVAWPPSFEEYNNSLLESGDLQNYTGKSEPIFEQQPSWRPVTAPRQNVRNTYSPAPPSSQADPRQAAIPDSQPPTAPGFSEPPSVITLREDAPFNQPTPPVFLSQPAAIKGLNSAMRGDEKWPPATVKAQAVAENEARKALAKGPVCRPKKVKKDYSSFFAQNALNPNYPGYRAPPGTQHYIEEGISNF